MSLVYFSLIDFYVLLVRVLIYRKFRPYMYLLKLIILSLKSLLTRNQCLRKGGISTNYGESLYRHKFSRSHIHIKTEVYQIVVFVPKVTDYDLHE